MAAKNFAFMAKRRKDKISMTALNNASTSLNVKLLAGGGGAFGVTFSEEVLMGYPEYQAFTYIWHYCPPLLLVVGVVGNLVTIVVLRRVWRHGSAQLPFLVSLAVADLCLLVSGLLFDVSFYAFGFDLREFHVVPCRVLTFVMNSANSVSAWLLVTVTAQRALSVTQPHRVARFCSPTKCYWMLAGIVSLACLFHLHVLVGAHVPGVHPEGFCTYQGSGDAAGVGEVRINGGGDGGDANPDEDQQIYPDEDLATSLASMWSMLDLVTACVLPSLTIIVCHVILIRGLRASERSLRSLTIFDEDDGRGRKSRQKLASSMTTAVRILSLAFICLTSPIYGYIIWSDARRVEIDADPHLLAKAELIWAVTNMLWYANPTANLLLYCISGGKFRKEFVALIKHEVCCYFSCCRGASTFHHNSGKNACSSGGQRSPGIDTVSSHFPLLPPSPSRHGSPGEKLVLSSTLLAADDSLDRTIHEKDVCPSMQRPVEVVCAAECTGSSAVTSQSPLAVVCSAELGDSKAVFSRRLLERVSSVKHSSSGSLCSHYPNKFASSTDLIGVSSKCPLTRATSSQHSLAQISPADVSSAGPKSPQSYHAVICSAELLRSNAVLSQRLNADSSPADMNSCISQCPHVQLLSVKPNSSNTAPSPRLRAIVCSAELCSRNPRSPHRPSGIGCSAEHIR